MSIKTEAQETLSELRRRGWTKGSFYAFEYDNDGTIKPVDYDECAVCLLGAWIASQYGTPSPNSLPRDAWPEYQRRFKAFVHEFERVIGFDPTSFNDNAYSVAVVEVALERLIEVSP